MSNEPPVQISPRQRRILRAIMPAGVILLVVWIGWMALALASGGVEAWWWGTPILGLITSLILIVTGYNYRRILAQQPTRSRS